jgi:hypothetical protein
MTSIVSISGGNAARFSLASAGNAPAFHTLNLRQSSIQKEKAITQRINEQNKKRQNMKELLIQNFLKKYMNRMDPLATAGNNGLIARVVANEVEIFMDREKGQGLNQKSLRALEKSIETILKQDPGIGPSIMDINPVR